MSRPVSIHSDGTRRGTVVLTEDGEQIENVYSVHFNMSAMDPVPEVNIEIFGKVSVNGQGTLKTTTFHCQLCEFETEHLCDPTMGGQGLPLQTVQGDPLPFLPLHSVIDYEMCGAKSNDGQFTCYINKDIDHTSASGTHFDTKNCASFR